MLRLIQAYSALFVTLVYSQHCHVLGCSVFKTGGLFNQKRWPGIFRHWPGIFRTLPLGISSHIQAYWEPCAILSYAKTWHMAKEKKLLVSVRVPRWDFFSDDAASKLFFKTTNEFKKILNRKRKLKRKIRSVEKEKWLVIILHSFSLFTFLSLRYMFFNW